MVVLKMKELALQKYLRENSVEKLEEELKIIVKKHPRHPNLHMFKYNQLECDMADPIVQNCRGIMLAADKNWGVACHVLNKFFNDYQDLAAPINWDDATVFEKLDGSLMQVFHYQGHWLMTTSGSPDGGGSVGSFNFTFMELFWNTWDDLGYETPTNQHLCYAFELCTKYNRIVVKHDKPRIVLLAARDRKMGMEVGLEDIGQNWEVVKQFKMDTLESLTASFEHIDPYEQEGYVVVDSKNFNRVKVKSPQYVAIHRIIGSMSPRRMIDVVRQEQGHDFLDNFPEWKELYDDVKSRYEGMILRTESVWESLKSIEDQKDFAQNAVSDPLSGALFQLRSGKISDITEFTSKMHIKKLEKLLGLNNEE